jgi:protein-S-isoprenylcysteine O-methyltransferase Ste14
VWARRLDAGATYAAGIVVFLAGLALMVPSVVAIGGVLALLLALQLQVRIVEEPYLANTHGAAYTAYAARAAGASCPASVDQ